MPKPTDKFEDVIGVVDITSPASQACVSLLKQILADAEKGLITTVGIVACGPSDFGAQIAGPDARSVNLGIDVLKAKIIAGVTQPAPSAILRPGRR